MKGLGVFLITIAVCISSWSAPVVQELTFPSDKPADWKPIIGFKHPTEKAFYDRNSLERKKIGSSEYSTGAILIFDSTPSALLFNGSLLPYISTVRHLVVDCKTGIMGILFDFFFDVSMPSAKDKPTHSIEYDADQSYIALKKSSLIYLTMCPVLV